MKNNNNNKLQQNRDLAANYRDQGDTPFAVPQLLLRSSLSKLKHWGYLHLPTAAWVWWGGSS